ncbi:MAG: EscU/YscU/HrcU family type III secretion system export apparatus switch protein [Actinomycetaceae bacterium]|nr:EscU/YscU/HrcU family type III secretion system export apparatus switch protein [Actinomycetaceae bacterium]
MSDSGEKTEKATPKKMKKVREDGGLQKSQDLTAWVALAGAAAVLGMVGSKMWDQGFTQFLTLAQIAKHQDTNMALTFFGHALASVPWTMAPLLVVVTIVAILMNVIQGRGVFPTLKKLKPKFQNFNIVKGLKRVFGLQALWNGLKAFLKTVAVGAVLYMVISSMQELLGVAGRLPAISLIQAISGKLWTLLWASIVAGIALSILDALFIFKKNQKQTKMSKQEVKEEYKSTEGNPEIKAQRRQKQYEISRGRQMRDTADADVVVVNPTHYAVSLRYEPGKGAPKVLSKGVDHSASKIREIALDNDVPMVEDVPLARTLYATCEVGAEIPEEMYTAVAQVLAFVMMLKKRGSATGVHKVPTYT